MFGYSSQFNQNYNTIDYRLLQIYQKKAFESVLHYLFSFVKINLLSTSCLQGRTMKLVFTDLDGTLLDYDTYSFADAKQALDFLKQNNIPVIINTSKTKSEVLEIRKALNIEKSPFIVENGGGIYFPESFDFKDLKPMDGFFLFKIGKSYEKILEFFREVKNRFKMRGFNQMSADDIMKLTHLSLKAAGNAKTREFSEPFILGREDKIKELKYEAFKYNITVTKGGRFYHLISNKQDKGIALLKTKNIYENILNEKVETTALGDGENDFSMLACCDYPVLIPFANGRYHNRQIPDHIKAPYSGAKGWNAYFIEGH